MNPNRHLVTGAVIATTLVLPLASQAQVTHARQAVKKTPIAIQKNQSKKITPPKSINKIDGAVKPTGQTVILGTVSAINGKTLTVNANNGKTYSVDASNAKSGEFIAPQADPLQFIVMGDKISAAGTLKDTTLVAKSIRNLNVNGRNIFSGTITAINGNMLTLKSRNTNYSINASGAVISQRQRPASKGAQPTQKSLNISDLKTNDRITVAGKRNGSTVTASNIQELGQPTHDIQSEAWASRTKQTKKK